MKNFWLVDVKSTENIDGNLVAFDYINTCYRYSEALEMGRTLSKNANIVCISIHRWVLLADGTQEHAEVNGRPDIPWEYVNVDHPENKRYVPRHFKRFRR